MNKNGKPTVAFSTLGCRVNQYETRAIEEEFIRSGFAVTHGNGADVCVINTCAVTGESERKSRQLIHRVQKLNPGACVLVCGCSSQLHPDIYTESGVYTVRGNRNKMLLVGDAVEYLSGNRTQRTAIAELSGCPCESMSITASERARAYIKIEDGCDNNCSYCAIRFARGPVSSRPVDEIIAETRALAASGYEEIVLTGIETAAYGRDLDGVSLCTLLPRVAQVDGISRIRLGSMEPSACNARLASVLSSIPQFMPNIHLSLQSGSDRILGLMRRKYNSAMLKKNIDLFREALPGITFTADIIVGFPGETEKDFADTCDIVRYARLVHAHIFPYSKREGTDAEAMPEQIPPQVKKRREEELTSLCAEIAQAEKQKLVGNTSQVLFETRRGGCLFGHTPEMLEAKLVSQEDLRGKTVNVRLTGIENGIFITERVK